MSCRPAAAISRLTPWRPGPRQARRIALLAAVCSACLAHAPSHSQTPVSNVQMGVSGVFGSMAANEVAQNLNARGIVSKAAADGTLQFLLGDGTTRATVRGVVSFSSGAEQQVQSVEFSVDGEAAAAQFVSWLFQTGGRYGAAQHRALTGVAMNETYCYSKALAVQVQLADRRASLLFTRATDALSNCKGSPAKRDFDAVAYQVGPPATPPDVRSAGPAGGGQVEPKADRAAMERRYADLAYCHGLYMRLNGLDALPPARRRAAGEAMVRVRQQGRTVQQQLGYSDAQAEGMFGQAAAMRLTGDLRNQQDVTRALADCRAKNAE